MPISLRTAALRVALERALGEPVHAVATERGMRLCAPAPDIPDAAAWEAALAALRTADRWGSASRDGVPEIWAEVIERQP